MPSPFPGMDPYIEGPAVWPDFHNRFIAAFSDAVNSLLPAPYYSAIANRIYVEDSDRRIEPDVDVLFPPDSFDERMDHTGGIAIADVAQARPVIVHSPSEEITEWFAEIYAAPGGEQLVTTIELLSPSNKRTGSEGRVLYLQKQREMLASRVNLVEIDLLRAGSHSTSVALRAARRKAGKFDYHACVHRFASRSDYELYPILLSQILPTIAIPLLTKHPDLQLPLQPIADRCYESGQYARRVRYESEPPGPLTDGQRVWVASRLGRKAN